MKAFFLNGPGISPRENESAVRRRLRKNTVGDNTDDGAVVLQGIWFHYVGVWIASGSVLCTCMLQLTICILSSNWRKIRLTPDLSER